MEKEQIILAITNEMSNNLTNYQLELLKNILIIQFKDIQITILTDEMKKIEDKETNENVTSGYGINIVNLSFNKNIMLNQSIAVKCSNNKLLLLLVNLKLPKEFITPKILAPGEDFTFLIEKVQIKEILEKVKYKKITIFFRDKSNIKYKIKIKRKVLEDYLNKI